MIDFGMVRIDDRLLHGQVVSVWIPLMGYDEIIIVDNEISQNSYSQRVLQLVAPLNVKLTILSEDEFSAQYHKYISQKTMVMVKSPGTIHHLSNKGVRFTKITIGALGIQPGRTPVFKNISLSRDEIEFLKRINSEGSVVVFQRVPDEPELSISDLKET